jgi:glycosyltransferase involved in cell wall biosynthesis
LDHGVSESGVVLRPIVFDLRDRALTGLGRVARETVRAYRARFPDDVVIVLESGGGRYSLRAQWEWMASLRRRYPDAVWVWFHWDVPWIGMPRRSVVYVNDLIHLDRGLQQAGWLKRTVARHWIQHAMRRAGQVVTGSHATAALLAVPAAVIPHGVSAEFGGAWAPQEYLLTVGDDRAYKNLAMARAVADALGVTWRHATGVSEATLNALYAGARVVLVPSRAEGFGLPVLEAFARGVPVVASDIAPLREISGGLATLVPPDDVAGWTSAVQRAWDEPGDAAPRRAWAATYTWTRSAESLREAIARL